jgi:hypothetical protein
MRLRRIAAATTAGLIVCCAAALGQDGWKTVTLNDDPNFTISIPAAINNYAPTADPDDLMVFSASTNDRGTLICDLFRGIYPPGSTQASFAAGLASRDRETFCKPASATVDNVDIHESESFNHGGLQGASCVASYTDRTESLPGGVDSTTIIAAARNMYVLQCNILAATQAVAEENWSAFWEEKVRHVRDSLRLPR